MAQDLGKLVTKYRAGVDSADKSAAFQLAVWEIEYESGGGGYSLSSGVFTETGNSTARGIAEGWLGDLGTLNTVQVQVLASPTNQDFLLVRAVPEPSSYAMLIGGLGLLAFTARRQRRQPAAQAAARPVGRR
ncbi:PEP-CTERM sorting domain-containing protein [Rugamonas sp. CCM 8940]|nr:PEP-CTERM sorting domain-containing protein [Rugamonas sp. CCM 8940]